MQHSFNHSPKQRRSHAQSPSPPQRSGWGQAIALTLKTLLQSRNTERGFAMPLAMGFGLVMLLVGTALLIRSQDDRVSATTQQLADSSLNVTEGGVTRVQAFINTYRPVARYNLSSWLTATTTLSVLNVCGSNIPTVIQNFATMNTTWQNIDSTDASKGQFRIANYTYVADNAAQPNSAPGRGILEVEGRLPDQTSINRLRVTIPVLSGDILGTPVPGLWISSGSSGGNQIQGNVLLNDCSTSVSNVNVTGIDPNTSQPYNAQHTNMQFPPLPPWPSPGSRNQLPNNINQLTLPRASDIPTLKQINGQTYQVYEYVGDRINMAQNEILRITPGQMVSIYLTQGISRGGDIQHNCDGQPASVGCRPTNFQIFGYGPVGTTICTNGNNYIDAFIFAPNYTVGVAGSGGTGGIRGAVWSREWSNGQGCGSNTSNIAVIQTANWNFIGLLPQNTPPRLTPPSTWARQEVP